MGSVTKKAWVLVGALVLLAMISQGCLSNKVDRKAFAASRPQKIGIVFTYEFITSDLSVGEEGLLIGALAGVGVVADEPIATQRPLRYPAEIRDTYIDRIVSQLEDKGYSVQMLATREVTYADIETSGEGPKGFDRCVAQYDVERAVTQVDAVLFAEVYHLFNGSDLEPGPAPVSERLESEGAAVDLRLFDCDTKRLLCRRRYNSGGSRGIQDLVDRLVWLDFVPPAAQQDGEESGI